MEFKQKCSKPAEAPFRREVFRQKLVGCYWTERPGIENQITVKKTSIFSRFTIYKKPQEPFQIEMVHGYQLFFDVHFLLVFPIKLFYFIFQLIPPKLTLHSVSLVGLGCEPT